MILNYKKLMKEAYLNQYNKRVWENFLWTVKGDKWRIMSINDRRSGLLI